MSTFNCDDGLAGNPTPDAGHDDGGTGGRGGTRAGGGVPARPARLHRLPTPRAWGRL
jgi:hypothetical protein